MYKDEQSSVAFKRFHHEFALLCFAKRMLVGIKYINKEVTCKIIELNRENEVDEWEELANKENPQTKEIAMWSRSTRKRDSYKWTVTAMRIYYDCYKIVRSLPKSSLTRSTFRWYASFSHSKWKILMRWQWKIWKMSVADWNVIHSYFLSFFIHSFDLIERNTHNNITHTMSTFSFSVTNWWA